MKLMKLEDGGWKIHFTKSPLPVVLKPLHLSNLQTISAMLSIESRNFTSSLLFEAKWFGG